MNKDKQIVLIVAIGVALIIGVAMGQWSVKRDIIKQYEDGSFYGCMHSSPCQDGFKEVDNR